MYDDVIQNGLAIRNLAGGIHRDNNHRKKIIQLLQLN